MSPLMAALLSEVTPYSLNDEEVLIPPLSEAQFLIKGLCTRLTSQKFLQCLHLVLPTSLLENRMSVAAAFFRIHGVFCEDREEHISRVDLGREVAVVTGIVTAD